MPCCEDIQPLPPEGFAPPANDGWRHALEDARTWQDCDSFDEISHDDLQRLRGVDGVCTMSDLYGVNPVHGHVPIFETLGLRRDICKEMAVSLQVRAAFPDIKALSKNPDKKRWLTTCKFLTSAAKTWMDYTTHAAHRTSLGLLARARGGIGNVGTGIVESNSKSFASALLKEFLRQLIFFYRYMAWDPAVKELKQLIHEHIEAEDEDALLKCAQSKKAACLVQQIFFQVSNKLRTGVCRAVLST
jgi:hypothetical protein